MKPETAWKIFFFLLLIVLLVAALPLAVAQSTSKSGPKYDLANELKLKGTVEDIKLIGAGDAQDTHLMLRADKGLVEICLCPAKFLTEMDMKFAKGDKLEVTGSKAKENADGTEVILAREIVRGETTLVLRDKQGGAVWTWMMKQ